MHRLPHVAQNTPRVLAFAIRPLTGLMSFGAGTFKIQDQRVARAVVETSETIVR